MTAIGAATAEKLWRGRHVGWIMDADPLPFPSPVVAPTMSHPLPFLLFFPSPLKFSTNLRRGVVVSRVRQ